MSRSASSRFVWTNVEDEELRTLVLQAFSLCALHACHALWPFLITMKELKLQFGSVNGGRLQQAHLRTSHIHAHIWALTSGCVCTQTAMKCADLGHLTHKWEVHRKWVEALEEEMWRQGGA
eukprot:1143456-Pelagomonas_calceolata.AAC.13